MPDDFAGEGKVARATFSIKLWEDFNSKWILIWKSSDKQDVCQEEDMKESYITQYFNSLVRYLKEENEFEKVLIEKHNLQI